MKTSRKTGSQSLRKSGQFLSYQPGGRRTRGQEVESQSLRKSGQFLLQNTEGYTQEQLDVAIPS